MTGSYLSPRPGTRSAACGKAASSLATGAFFAFHSNVFIYLLNFIVDGSLVVTMIALWVISAPLERYAPT